MTATAPPSLPTEVKALQQRVLDQWQAGEREAAITLLNEAITRFPDDAMNHRMRGVLLGESQRYDAAIADLRWITERTPDDIDWGIMGWYLLLQADFSAAQAASAKAHALAPDQHLWIINLGHAYLLQGERETAHTWYQKAVPLIPDEEALYFAPAEKSLKWGPLAAFDLFIERGWQVEASRKREAR